MENVSYKILIIATGCYYSHVIRFVSNLKKINPKAEITLFAGNDLDVIPQELSESVSEIIFNKNNNKTKGSLRSIYNKLSLIREFRQLSKTRKFDIVNIHFPILRYALIMPFIKKMTKKIVVSPWGSDILRVNGRHFKLLCKLVIGKCDYITLDMNSTMGAKVSSAICKPKEFYYPLEWGSETIDYISNSNNISIDDAKASLGISGFYVITCGYNAYPAQRHEVIIDAIVKERQNLPSNIMLLFPVTYGFEGRREYIVKLKEKCKAFDIPSVFFEDFLSLSELYNLRMATDMFIHVQTTDVGASSVLEYILCRKKIIHGTWVPYPHLEKYPPLFYYPVNELAELGSVISKTFQADPIDISQDLIEDIKKRGWNAKIKLWNNFFININK